MEGNKKKRGRPKQIIGECSQLNTRLGPEDRRIIEDLMKYTGKSQTGVVRFALKFLHKSMCS